MYKIEWSGYALGLTGPEYCKFHLVMDRHPNGQFTAKLHVVSNDNGHSAVIPLAGTVPASWVKSNFEGITVEFENDGTGLKAPIKIEVGGDQDRFVLRDDDSVKLENFDGLFASCPVPGPEDDDPEAVSSEIDEIIAEIQEEGTEY